MSTDLIPLRGRVVRENPTITFSQSGTAVTRFTLVTSGRKQNKQTGAWEDVDVTYYRCVAFSQLAENIAENIERGTSVILIGRLSQEDWTDKNGNPRNSIKVVVENLGEDLRWRKTKGQEASTEPSEDDPPF